MCKKFDKIENFVEYLINERKLTQFDDEIIKEEFDNYKGLAQHQKHAFSTRSLTYITKIILRRSNYKVELLPRAGRRIYAYSLIHSNGNVEATIKIENTIPAALH